VGGGSPGSREAKGEDGEGFYIARRGRRADLLVIGGRRVIRTWSFGRNFLSIIK
jgi:hypothetical protein